MQSRAKLETFNTTMMYRKIITALLTFIPIITIGQTTLDTAKNDLTKVNSWFDSSRYIGFDARFMYFTDTVAGKFEYMEKKAEYYLNKNHFYMNSDGMEHIQNDSFSIEIDNNQKTLIVSPNINGKLAEQFMLKDFMSQSLDIYANIYTISITDIDTFTRETKFVTNNSASPYSEFSIRYDTSAFLPISMHFTLTEKLPFEIKSGSSTKDLRLKQQLAIYFSDFRGMTDPSIFNETTFVRYDIATKKYEASKKYQDYRFYSLGFDDDETELKPDELIETNEETP